MFQTLHEISKNLIFVFVWKYVKKKKKKKRDPVSPLVFIRALIPS